VVEGGDCCAYDVADDITCPEGRCCQSILISIHIGHLREEVKKYLLSDWQMLILSILLIISDNLSFRAERQDRSGTKHESATEEMDITRSPA
jgi:hypothetical protein